MDGPQVSCRIYVVVVSYVYLDWRNSIRFYVLKVNIISHAGEDLFCAGVGEGTCKRAAKTATGAGNQDAFPFDVHKILRLCRRTWRKASGFPDVTFINEAMPLSCKA
jgi:hypothetical protein